MGICVQEVSQLRSGRRDQEISKASPLTPHCVSVVRGPEVAKLHSLTELCGLQVSVKTYIAPKGPLQFKRCQDDMRPGVLLVVRLTPQGSAVSHSSSLSVVAVEETTQPTTGTVLSGKRPRWLLLSGRLLKAARGRPTRSSCRAKGEPSGPENLGLVGTTLSVRAVLSRLLPQPIPNTLQARSLKLPHGVK